MVRLIMRDIFFLNQESEHIKEENRHLREDEGA